MFNDGLTIGFDTMVVMKNKVMDRLISDLKQQWSDHKDVMVTIPRLWNKVNNPLVHETFYGTIQVNPYQHLLYTIDALMDQTTSSLSTSILKKPGEGAQWIKDAVVYSTQIRSAAAYDLDQDGYISTTNIHGLNEAGTFIKMIWLLPHLIHIGVDTLYFLPFFKHSVRNKKGDCGSSYAISCYTKLDETLYDPMVPSLPLMDQAKAFFELAHGLGIKTIIDIIPRTAALDSDYIIDHPEWFYWIHTDHPFWVPKCEFMEELALATPQNMEMVYQNEPSIQEYIGQFSFDPKTLDEHLYLNCVKKANGDASVYLNLIEQCFGISVCSAFSDRLNDYQAPWSDVAYTRLYLDAPSIAQKYYPSDVPYIFFDSAKASLNPGKIKNQPLWDVLENIVTYWQNQFGIDGVRLDMGHALPDELIQGIIHNAQANDPQCVFIAEELDTTNHHATKLAGYDVLSGNGFSEEHRILEHRLSKFYYGADQLDLPVFALGESHDTPRLVQRNGGKRFARMVTLLNLFMPNGIPFINNGQECYEKAPLNIGLDASAQDEFAYPKDDPRYGKLGLFDFTWFDWKEEELVKDLSSLIKVRDLVKTNLFESNHHWPLWFDYPDILAVGSIIEVDGLTNEYMIAFANAYDHRDILNLHLDAMNQRWNGQTIEVELIYSTDPNAMIHGYDPYHIILESEGYSFSLMHMKLK